MFELNKKNITAIIIACVFASLLYVIGKAYPEDIVILFSFPAAKLSSLFLGVPYVKSDVLTYTLRHSNITLRIIESCSGYNFWIILFTFYFFQLVNRLPFKRAAVGCVLLLPASYFLTIIINTCRVLSSFYLKLIGSSYLSAKYSDVLHLWTGIIIFLSALILIYIIFQRRISYEA